LSQVVHDVLWIEVGVFAFIEADSAEQFLSASCGTLFFVANVENLLVPFAIALGSVLLPIKGLLGYRRFQVDHLSN